MTDREPVIRDACRDDLPRLVELLADDQIGREREAVTDPLAPGYYSAFEALHSDPRARLLVADVDGRVVGTLQLNFLVGLSRRGAVRAQIEAVRIAREVRGQGLGHILMAAAIDLARQRGCRLVQVTTDLRRENAYRFYQSLGFVHSHAGMKLSLEGHQKKLRKDDQR